MSERRPIRELAFRLENGEKSTRLDEAERFAQQVLSGVRTCRARSKGESV